MHNFEPTLEAAHERLAAVNPQTYASTRNALEGAVTRLSPYLTHGLLRLPEVYAAVHARHGLDAKHKLVFEWGWRAYYRHVWAHLGDGIHQSLHPGLLPDHDYSPELPRDVLEARTGIAVIDLAVRTLYETGYVHNHARMWLASYLVHLRKVHWHAAAQWMLGHLLDGDLASNHLSWQWVAGTGSVKPYLFNADNVAKYAPVQWHSPGTVLDTSYEALHAWASKAAAVETCFDARQAGAGVAVPALYASPPPGPGLDGIDHGWCNPMVQSGPLVAGRDVWLHHPWSLCADAALAPAGALHVGVGFEADHTAMPWSARRWDFVTRGLKAQTQQLWWGSAQEIGQALRHAKTVHWQPDPHASPALTKLKTLLLMANPIQPVQVHEPRCLFEAVDLYCPSFSQWWRQTRIAHHEQALRS